MTSLGLSPNQRLYLPEQLFFNPQTEVVGVLRNSNFKWVHPSHLRLLSELESEFYRELRARFMDRQLRVLRPGEKRIVDMLLWAANIVGVYDTSKVEFPEEGGQYYFFKMILVLQHVKSLVMFGQEGAWTRFRSDIIPKLDDIFCEQALTSAGH